MFEAEIPILKLLKTTDEHSYRLSHYKPFQNEHISFLEYPVKICQIPMFECKNFLRINVLHMIICYKCRDLYIAVSTIIDYSLISGKHFQL